MSDIFPTPPCRCFNKCTPTRSANFLQLCLFDEPIIFDSAIKMCESYDMELIHLADQFERKMVRDVVASNCEVAVPSIVWAAVGDMKLPAKYSIFYSPFQILSICLC